jgi:Delta7-sterol 5-desaturase
MDVILEIWDTYLGDYVFAHAHPAQSIAFNYFNVHNTTTSTWEYKPASSYIEFEPSRYAFMSAWDRDNIYRQAISLWTITVYEPTFFFPA